ncbi:DUF1392 family protein [Aulosira sp. FACHB-615]|uniref:DUF1392 family protein n=1 Tax=Aulosira sp. FACHB-615 TaxID=2692777 RepID=UPI001686E6F7|nr:DUF1392 family protein [Aulosira sp. FACHB-615]MBD2492288.1 DUF1392 family protein [Aulosira sp. FACHB-615]
MTEKITDLERCWYLSPSWGFKIYHIEAKLFERVYLKTNRKFGHCCGVKWLYDNWIYSIDTGSEVLHATKHQIIATGRQINTNFQPEFALGDRVLLRSLGYGKKQRLVLGIQLVDGAWFYLIEFSSPSLDHTNNKPNRFYLIAEKDLVKVNV